MMVEVTNREMSGPIECIATNGVGEPAVAGINMIVLCKFLILIIVWSYKVIFYNLNFSSARN